ncbi:hypothetical protein I4U23_009477 [Adineta vaga]|nr:hypothetical protein I4U23_009477 [Adineta vaga]
MTERLSRDMEYVILPQRKVRKPTQYYYESDDDNESQVPTVTKRIVRGKPVREQNIKYVTADELDRDHRRSRQTETNDHKIKIRNTNNGEPVILDEDGNVLKVIRSARTPTPPPSLPIVENRRIQFRSHEPRTVYYETTDGRLVTQPAKVQSFIKPRAEIMYTDHEPTKLVRKVIIDPRTGDQETIYEDKPKRHHRKKFVVRKQSTRSPVESDGEYEQESQYVQVVQRQTAPTQIITKQVKPTTKYVMIRKKVDSGSGNYMLASSDLPMKNNRRVVYETTTKKPTTTYVYSADDKYYK